MSEPPSTDSPATPPESREGAGESWSSPGKDDTARRKSVYFQDASESGDPNAGRILSLPRNSDPQAPVVQESVVNTPGEDSSGAADVKETNHSDEKPEPLSAQASPSPSSSSAAPQPSSQSTLPQPESPEAASSSSPPMPSSPTDPEKQGSDSEQIQIKIDQSVDVETTSSEHENMAGKGRRLSKRASSLRRKSSLFKEIVGSIEKKKGPIVPDKLGFGSSEERKALMVETKRKSTVVAPQPEAPLKPLERRKTAISGYGFGSSAKRTTVFDIEDPKTKEKRKSVYSKEDEKDEKGGAKGRRVSESKDPGSLVDPRAGGGLSTTAALLAAAQEETGAKAGEGAEQDMSQAPDGQQLNSTDMNQFSEENQQQLQHSADDKSQEAGATVDGSSTTMEVVVGGGEEPVSGDETDSVEEKKRLKYTRDRAPSIFYDTDGRGSNSKYNKLRAPSIDSIPLDDNEGLTTSLLAGKVDDPLRNQLENWLSSAINRVDSNLSSSLAEPVLRNDSSEGKGSTRRASDFPQPRAPRNTLVAQPDSSSTSTKGLSRRPSLTSFRNLRRVSALTLNILEGTVSDENVLLKSEELTDPTVSPQPVSPLQDSSATETTMLSPKVVKSRDEGEGEGEGEAPWTQETAEEGLRRLQREVEQRAWATNVAKKSPRLSLPDSLRKRKKPAESVAASDYLHSESGLSPVQDNILNKDFLCQYGGAEEPEKLKNAGLSGLSIVGVEETDLDKFKNLQCLDLSVNQVNMQQLFGLSQLRKLSLMSNQMYHLKLLSGQFDQLQALDLSYNLLGGSAIVDLSNLPALETLNLDHNSIAEIPEASGEPWSFPRLRVFSAAHNFIKSRSLLPMSKIPRLEKLLLSHNKVRGVPNEMNENCTAFCRLEILDLTNNTVADSHRLTPLLQCRSLKQRMKCNNSLGASKPRAFKYPVLLWATPVARKLACDGANKLLDSARPVLKHILRAQQAGQSWVTQQPRPQTVELEEKMHIIPQYKAPDIKLFDRMAEQEMAQVFKYTSEEIAREAGDKHCGLHKGYTSQILPFTDGFQSPVMSIYETKSTDRVPSEVATSNIPPSVDEAMDNIQVSTNLTKNHLSDASAAIVCLQNTLGVPFREVDFNPKHYLTLTKSGIIRVNEYRLGNQELTSPRKDAVYLAQRFLYQSEMDERNKVHNVLARMRLHLAEMDDVLNETLVQPPLFSPPRRMSSVGNYTDSEGMLTFR